MVLVVCMMLSVVVVVVACCLYCECDSVLFSRSVRSQCHCHIVRVHDPILL